MTTIYVREISLKYRGPRRGTSFDAVSAPELAATFLRRVLPDPVREHFLTLFLDQRNQVTGYFVAATGTAASCPVGTKEIFQAALVSGATSILVAHNHTSMPTTPDIQPSAEDLAVTRRLCEAGNLLGIPVVDHLIVSQDGFYSFLEHGQIPSRRT